ncbi:hypothetical protein GQ53DRAFT_832978 [Thozetella sp. PMI_491]|nr:hypothetical protein GQ53DRAFT_832978 [Thozetella sp. PMI_491]
MANVRIRPNPCYMFFNSKIRGTHYSSAPTAALLAPKVIPQSSDEEISNGIKVLAAAFDKVPCTNAFSLESGQTVPEYVEKTVRESLRSASGTLVEAGDGSAVALWELPHLEEANEEPGDETETAENPAHGSVGSIKKEWKSLVRSAKQKFIGVDHEAGRLRPHLHLDFVGRNPHAPKVPGAVSAVLVPFLGLAEQDNLPVWLEATSPAVVELYKHYGFRVLQEITVGRDRVDAKGRARPGGEGVQAWFMLIENHPE